jgi:hypothetical protein
MRSMKRMSALVWGIAGFSALVLSCSRARPPEAAAAHFVVADVIVSVTNQSPRELQIYVGTAALEHSLGRVPGRSSRSFSLPSGLGDSTGPLHFEARGRRDGISVRSDTFSVAAGQQVLWAIGESGSGSVTKR